MNQLIEKLNLAFPALAIIAVAFLAGITLEKVVLTRLRKIAQKNNWQGGIIIINSMHGMVMLWCVISGGNVALYSQPLNRTLLHFFQQGLEIVTIFTATVVVARMAIDFINLYSQGTKGILPSISISSNITKLVIYIIGLLIILQTLGISITPILTALGVGGLAVALALRDTLANLFSGLHILFSEQVNPGDYIKLNTGEEGYVTDITWRNTTIRTIPNNLIIVPNVNLASSTITNFNLPVKDVPVGVTVGVSYASDLDKVEKTSMAVAAEVMAELGAPGFEPSVNFQTFGDFRINFLVNMRAKEFTDQGRITHEFIKRLHRRFHDEGIEISLPARTVLLKKE